MFALGRVVIAIVMIACTNLYIFSHLITLEYISLCFWRLALLT